MLSLMISLITNGTTSSTATSISTRPKDTEEMDTAPECELKTGQIKHQRELFSQSNREHCKNDDL